MKIDCHIKDICKMCVTKNCQSETKWRALVNAQYIHPYAGIRSEGDVGRVYVTVDRNLVPGGTG